MRDDWSVKEVVEPKSGKVHRLYWYKGKLCKRIPLDSPVARQMAGYVLIEKDLRSASVWLEEVARIRGDDAKLDAKGSRNSKDRDRYNLVKGLFVAALTFYGKAFAQCEGRRVKLERRQLSAEFHEAHDDAIAFRNNFAAHSGAKLIERAEIAIALPFKAKQALPRLYSEMTQPDYVMSPKGEKSFEELLAHVRDIPLRKISQLHEKIMRDEVLPKGRAYWDAK
jgi:hypothetical protein